MANGDFLKLPEWIKILMVCIDRVGFPILVSIMMFYVVNVTLAKNTQVLDTVVKSIIEWQVSTVEFRKMTTDKLCDLRTEVVGNQKTIQISLDRLHDKVRNN